MDDKIITLSKWIKESNDIVFLGGAGTKLWER